MNSKFIAGAVGALMLLGSGLVLAERGAIERSVHRVHAERDWRYHERRDWDRERDWRDHGRHGGPKHHRKHDRGHGHYKPYWHHHRHHYGHGGWRHHGYDHDGVTIIFRGSFY